MAVQIVDIFRDESGTPAEPVTLDEAKAWLLVDFADDDALITSMITKARAWVEDYCHISITPKEVTATFLFEYVGKPPRGLSRWDWKFFGYAPECESVDLPYGPVQEGGLSQIFTTDAYGNNPRNLTEGTDYYLVGTSFPKLKITGQGSQVTVVYDTGYDKGKVPQGLKTAILQQTAFLFEQRGSTLNRYQAQSLGASEGAMESAQRFIQPWL